MLRTILTYGTAAGLIVGIPLFIIFTTMGGHPPGWAGMAIGYLTMLIALSTVFVAIKRRRDVELGGVIRFWPAFGMGLAISAVAGLFYVLAWEAAIAASDTDFATMFANMMIEQEKAKGTSGAALQAFTAEMEKFRMSYANPLYRVPMTFSEILPVGVLVSLVSAALLRNSRFMPARSASASL